PPPRSLFRGFRLGYHRIVPAAVLRHQVHRRGRTPGTRLVRQRLLGIAERRIDDAPRGFDGIVATEKFRIAPQSIAEQARIRRALAPRLVARNQLHVLAAHLLAWLLDPRAGGYHHVRAEAEAEIIRILALDVVEHVQRRAPECDQHFGAGDRHFLAGADVERHAGPAPGVD